MFLRPMNSLTVEIKQGERQLYTFVGWHEDQVAFYAREQGGNPKLVELSPAYPPNLDTGQPFAFPNLAPTKIYPTCLTPPVSKARNRSQPEKGAKETGIDLAEMKKKAQEFAVQWRTQFGTEHQPSHEMMMNDRDAVRFCIQFAIGIKFYLHGFQIRNLLTPDEATKFASLSRTLEPHPQEARETIPPAWHSEGFATVRRRSTTGSDESLTLTNEARALCQLLNDRPDKIAQYSEIEAQIGPRIHELDTAVGTTKPSGKGPRRVRDMLRTKIGEKLLNWKVLVSISEGREKFLKLCPPTTAE
jgi:hypothetical protein